MFHIKLQFLSHWTAQHRACLTISWGVCVEGQSTRKLSILAHSSLPARTQAHIPVLLSVLASAVKGSTQQVMGCVWGGMQITKVPFQPRGLPERWHSLADQHCSRSRPQPPAIAAMPHAKCCLSSQAGELLDTCTFLQGPRDRRTASR